MAGGTADGKDREMKRLEKEIQDRLRMMAQLRASEPEAAETPVPTRLFGQGKSPRSPDSLDSPCSTMVTINIKFGLGRSHWIRVISQSLLKVQSTHF